jgi:chemotaxis protein methyltransferase CheR
MSAEVFDRLCALIHQHSRIHLTPNKLNMLSSRLGKRRRELELSSWDDYLAWLTQQGPDEMDMLIDLVATNHTHFFREAVQFEILQADLLGALLARSPTAKRGLRCWSAGCSSGEEVFTLPSATRPICAGRSRAPTFRTAPCAQRRKPFTSTSA